MLENWGRPYLQESMQKPHLFYAVLGKFEIDEEFEKVAGASLAGGLGCRLVEASHFREGVLWDMAPESIREEAEKAVKAVVIEGEIQESNDLEYLRGAIDFLSYCCEVGGTVVHDPYTLNWFSREDWLQRTRAGQILNPFDHVVLLISDDWYHTRGMLKFGRPDLSVKSVTPDERDGVKKIIDRFINFQALGGVIEEGREIKVEGFETTFKPGPVRGDQEDPDFNNCHVELLR